MHTTFPEETTMDLLTRCALLIFALLNYLDQFATRLGLQRAPHGQRIAGAPASRS
jgi:hypothetical protein